MQLKYFLRLKRKSQRRASVAVEFALITTFFLLPLFCGAADFVSILNAKAQLNTAIQALIYYSWTNTTAAMNNTNSATTTAEIALISAINSASTFHITLNAGSTAGSYSNLEYYCLTTTSTPYQITASTSATCGSSQTSQTFVQFTVSTSVLIPFPLPVKLRNPFPLTTTGSVQVK